MLDNVEETQERSNMIEIKTPKNKRLTPEKEKQ